MKLEILYEDNHVIAAVKPCNMPSQADASKDLDIQTALKAYIKEKYNKPGNVYLGLLHRLDRPAGGAMLFARTSKAAARLSRAFREGGIDKTYCAVLNKAPDPRSGTLENYLIKDTEKNISRLASPDEKGAKKARLSYHTIGVKEGLALVRIGLCTGRAHQIRVQFAGIGCPLFGDARYGGAKQEQLALWSCRIAFAHPVTQKTVAVISEPPGASPWNLFPGAFSDLI